VRRFSRIGGWFDDGYVQSRSYSNFGHPAKRKVTDDPAANTVDLDGSLAG